MKGVIRDTGLDHLTRVLFKQDPSFPTQHSTWWQRCYNEPRPHKASTKATVIPGSRQNGKIGEERLVQRPCNDILDGIERGGVDNLVGWNGPDDSEVLLYSTP